MRRSFGSEPPARNLRGRKSRQRQGKAPVPAPPAVPVEAEAPDERDLRLGSILVEAGAVRAPHVEECLKLQEELGRNGLGTAPKLGELLVRGGYARPEQIEEALDLQESAGRTCPSCGEHTPALVLDMGDGDACPACGTKYGGRLQAAPVPAAPPPAPRFVPSLPSEPVPPELRKFGRYELSRELGRGSMGVVYEALDPALGRKVALKLLHQRTGPDVEQFMKEARLSASLPRHPNIVTVYEAGVADGRHYIAMELIDGQPLSAWKRKSFVTPRQQTRLLRDVALAVHHAHEHGILHCDLKPANVMVDSDRRAFVTDFGLARRSGRDAWVAQEAGMTAGTPAYMSPEQAMGRAQMDRRTDVYSLGVMLYEIFTGRIPFRATTPEELLDKTVRERVRPPSTVARSLAKTDPRGTIDAVCLKALAKKPSQRHPTAKALADDLSRWLRGEALKPPPARTPVPGWLAGLAVAAAVLVCVGIAKWTLGSGDLAPSAAAVAPPLQRLPEGRPASSAELIEKQAELRRVEQELERARSELAQKAKAEKAALEAQALPGSAGRVPLEWFVAGPFDNRGMESPCPPELGIRLDAEMPGKAGPVRWQRALAGLSATGAGRAAVLDFASLFTPNTKAAAYALIHVKAPAPLEALLLVGSDDGVRVWANGRLVHTNDTGRGVKLDEDHVPVRLQAGWNRLLFKVTQWNQGWGLAARITDLNLRPVDGLIYDAVGDLPLPAAGR